MSLKYQLYVDDTWLTSTNDLSKLQQLTVNQALRLFTEMGFSTHGKETVRFTIREAGAVFLERVMNTKRNRLGVWKAPC